MLSLVQKYAILVVPFFLYMLWNCYDLGKE